MKAIFIKIKSHVEREDTMARIVCFTIALSVFFIMKVLNREVPL
jgi:hypothetical protein